MKCIALLVLATGCNSILGVEDVELNSQPDGGGQCDVISHFASISSALAGTNLIHGSRGNPSLLFVLNSDPKPDSFSLQLYDNLGNHGVLNAPGTYSINAADSKLETCGLCVLINTDFDSSKSEFSQTYLAEAQGSLTLTKADATGLAGSMTGLKLRHVDISGASTTDENDGCEVTVDRVSFDVMYETEVAAGQQAVHWEPVARRFEGV